MKRKSKRTKSKNMCFCCYYANCDPAHGFVQTFYIKKRNFRLKNNLCVSCGKNPCGCKRRDYPSNVDK